MSLGDHLKELRRRFIFIALGVVLGAIAGWFLSDLVYDEMQRPIMDLQRDMGIDASLNFPEATSALDIKVRISLTVGLIVSSPWWMYQFWAFINPGLTTKERRYTLGFVGAGVPLFLGGVAMAWIALPNTIRLLHQFVPAGETASSFLTAQVYLKFVINFILIFGFAFLLPLIMVVMNFLGVVRALSWLKAWRWAVIVIFLLSALATPTAEPVTFILMAVPIIILYFLAIGVCLIRDRWHDKKFGPPEPKFVDDDDEDEDDDDAGSSRGRSVSKSSSKSTTASGRGSRSSGSH